MCILICLLSLVGLVWGNYYLVTSALIGSVCGFVNICLLIKSGSSMDPNMKSSSMVLFVISYIVRTLMMIAGVGLSALVIYLTFSGEKMDYLNILMSGVPFILMTLILSFVKIEKGENKDEAWFFFGFKLG